MKKLICKFKILCELEKSFRVEQSMLRELTSYIVQLLMNVTIVNDRIIFEPSHTFCPIQIEAMKSTIKCIAGASALGEEFEVEYLKVVHSIIDPIISYYIPLLLWSKMDIKY